jgi:hypothetical protein
MKKNLFVKVLAATLLGIGLPAAAATPALASTCQTSVANAVRPAGSPALPAGSFVCEYGVTWRHYDSRWHVFLVGTNSANSIYHAWQNSATGPYGGWTSLGGTGRGVILTQPYTTAAGAKALEIAVPGVGGPYCKNYNGTTRGGWWPGPTTWTGNAASCRLF